MSVTPGTALPTFLSLSTSLPPGGKRSASGVPRLLRRYHPVWLASPLPLRCLFLIVISRAPLSLVPLASPTSLGPRAPSSPAPGLLGLTGIVSGGRNCLQFASLYTRHLLDCVLLDSPVALV
ncbi:uncharacterized protein LACBIDRAFT_318553 [Laccaria bicolor S238N-H82]|uniref:Predicted protein n=1 Tax=Laccaria bicolor (strain S238N-H82 / ATCC MYA-4686) TaxID=486041 RepID=B0DY90_LACBS|nr:uncharacterized protein LACBIDRAFT_314304 [Laccaria bicolor S238N-H82]XP_001890442.1 uncharacterized protein LACBIDRAFT_318553 [Laccaria bicolor S238N-H82]EDQ98897.1 predicted protein [Laccaria bicolor S238N-H82]EDR00349.1 predicted protein [Laccaria bicolor S238N-H82]|eukprot:XP_001888908.1 predicted protein [Laccaria bicolor S238N-H82]